VFRRLEGDLSRGKTRAPAREIPVRPGVPVCPEYLDGHAREFWASEAPRLARLGVLSADDLRALEAGCLAYESMRLAREPGGDWRAASDAWRRLLAFLREYGLTAASRARVSALSPASDPSVEADFS